MFKRIFDSKSNLKNNCQSNPIDSQKWLENNTFVIKIGLSMREAAFIKKNKESWLLFEELTKRSTFAKADEFTNLFLKANNDLAYAQTYYPKSKLIDYLNALVANAQNKIYTHKKPNQGFKNFWLQEIPLMMHRYRWYFYFSFLLYFVFVGIGWISSVYEPEFVRSILGNSYVDMTENNVANGDPLAVYNNESALEDFNSFFRICLNNLRVGLNTIIWGLAGGLGSVFVMMHNGIMVGSFQYMFYENGNFLLSLRTIWIHGAMELFAMCIEVGVGVLIGVSWVFPGSLSRWQAFKVKGKAGIKVFISTLPFTIIAAILEGYVTQYANEMPLTIAFFIVLSSLSLIGFYYLILPFYVYQKQQNYGLIVEDIAIEKV